MGGILTSVLLAVEPRLQSGVVALAGADVPGITGDCARAFVPMATELDSTAVAPCPMAIVPALCAFELVPSAIALCAPAPTLALVPAASASLAPVAPQVTLAPSMRHRPLCTSCVNTACNCAKFTAWSACVAAVTPPIVPAF